MKPVRIPLGHFLVPLVLATAAPPAFADVLVLANGDRITGDIKHIWDDKITTSRSMRTLLPSISIRSSTSSRTANWT